MKEKLGVVFWDWFNKTAAIYMVMILIGLLMNGNFSHRTIKGLMLISGGIPLLESIVFSNFFRKISYYLKLSIHYLLCFVLYIILSTTLRINGVPTWNFKDWAISIVIYTIVYWSFSYFYMLKHKNEVKHLNQQLNKFKENFSKS